MFTSHHIAKGFAAASAPGYILAITMARWPAVIWWRAARIFSAVIPGGKAGLEKSTVSGNRVHKPPPSN
jgi:hypothetical protein